MAVAAVYLMGATWSCKLIMKNAQHVAAVMTSSNG